jgi:hypothetical protein
MTKPRKPTDNSKALPHVLRNRLGLIINSSGHVLVCNSSTTDPVCQKPPSDGEIDAMISHDIVEHYRVTAKSSNIAAGGVFDHKAIANAAKEFIRTEGQIKNLLRNAGYGRRGLTTKRSD